MAAIPDVFLEFSKELADLCARYDFNAVTTKVTPGFRHGWSSDVNVMWQSGRHGEDSNAVKLSSTSYVRCDLKRDGSTEVTEW